ncbi:ATP-binding protein [Chitinibacter tainanensis]|uniref:ATP-binding protein n=1 Tax=Chitinibacter tainanensis TaxID=230667 RepID=UPI002357ACCE|nr:ATP-binding protein [Chitinibacter tainanensis]
MPIALLKSLTLRLRIAFIVVAATTLIAGLAAFWVFRSVDQTYSNISRESYPATRAVAGLETNSLELALALHQLSSATNDAERREAFRTLQQLQGGAPLYLDAIRALKLTESGPADISRLQKHYQLLAKQAVETNQIVTDLIEIEKQNAAVLAQVDEQRQQFEQKIEPLLHKAQEEMLLATGRASVAAGQQWAKLTEQDQNERLATNLIRADIFRLASLIAVEGEEGYRRKGPEILERLEKQFQLTDPEFRDEGLKMLKILRGPMRSVSREALGAMMDFYRNASKFNQREMAEHNRQGDLITQSATASVVNLVNTQVQTLTASEQLKSDYLELSNTLRRTIAAKSQQELAQGRKDFAQLYQHAQAAGQKIVLPQIRSGLGPSLNAVVMLNEQSRKVFELAQRRLTLESLLEKIARENTQITQDFLQTTQQLGQAISGALSGKVVSLDRDIRSSSWWLLGAAGLAVVVALVMGWFYISNNINRRLERLAQSMRQLSEGELAEPIIVQGDDEISDIERGVMQFRALLQQQNSQQQALIEARDEAQAAAKIKSEFLANMSHEIRTPLSAILGYTQLVSETPLSSLQQQYLTRAQSSAQMLLGVVNDVLDFSKIEAHKLEVEREPFDLMQLLSQLAGTVAIQAQDKDLRLNFEIDPRVPHQLVGDSLRLGQVLLNLLNNAVKFTERGDVTLSLMQTAAEAHEVELAFAVRDSGIGINPQARERLFQLFSQADSSTTRRFGGSGLGLAISQQLIQLMGGCIEVDSEPGLGSCFRFTLRMPRGPQTVSLPQFGERHAVIADQNEDHAAHLALHLAALGISSTALNNPAQLAAYFEGGHPLDLLLIQPQFCLTDQGPCPQIVAQVQGGLPLILLCYGADDMASSQLPAFGGAPLISKPYIPSQIVQAVAQQLARDERALALAVGADAGMALSGLRVLLVEDTDVLLDLGATVLRNLGAQVTPVGSGNAAIAALMSMPIDVVLMDVQMPEMDGRDTTRAIRALPGFAELPIIALTAHAMEGERELCLAAGMNEHLCKPIDAQKLQQALRPYCRGDRQGEAVAPAETALMATMAPLTDADALLDFPAALQQMGSLKLLHKMLPRFVERFADCEAVLRGHLAAGQFADAQRYAHTLKGVAAQVAAGPIYALAGELELQLQAGVLPDEAALVRLGQLQAQAGDLIAQWLAKQEEATPV